MAFMQRILPECQDHGSACAVIDCVATEPVLHHETGEVIHEAGAVVWHSHMDSAVHPEHRLNPDHPAEDHRQGSPVPVSATTPCEACQPLMPA